MIYPIFQSHSQVGCLPDDDIALSQVDPTKYQYRVGTDHHGNDIMTCLVGIGNSKIHNVYRHNDGTWKFLFLRSI
jgi:hypothetical protein